MSNKKSPSDSEGKNQKSKLFWFLIFSLIFFTLFLKQKDQLFNKDVKKNLDLPTKKKIQVIATSLHVPWEIEFLDSGEIVVTERNGYLYFIKAKKRIKVDEVVEIGEGGLLGMAKDPDFKSNNYLYLYLTTRKNSQLVNQVVRFQLVDYQLKNKKIILDDIPANNFHNGGRIAFGPDGYLYMTTGDAQNPELSQEVKSLAGKILRVTKDGLIPEDNPENNLIFSLGHRNSQGIAWDDQGRLWSTEHGRSGLLSGFDELNLIEKGKNYGWPKIQGDQEKEGMRRPIVHSGEKETWAPAAIIFYQGKLYFTGLRGESLYQYDLKNKSLNKFFNKEFGRLRALRIGPDGYFYLATSNTDGRGQPKEDDDKILKINPQYFDR